MTEGFEALLVPYNGRIIIGGKTPNGLTLGALGITVRTPEFQQRKIVFNPQEHNLRVNPLDQRQLSSPDAHNLFYRAIDFSHEVIVVTNGDHTNVVKAAMLERDLSGRPGLVIAHGLEFALPEDDPPKTSRIAACLAKNTMALGIVKREGEDVARMQYEFQLKPGAGKLIKTYQGNDIKLPLPFAGEPLDVTITSDDPKTIAHEIHDALAPQSGSRDYRVAVAAVVISPSTLRTSGYIINHVAGEEYATGEF